MSDLKANLRNFTGTERYYCHPFFPKFRYTDGIQYLAHEAGAYWWIEYIFGRQSDKKIHSELFQVWTLKINKDQSATLHVSDGNENTIRRFTLAFTDFPLKEFTLWFIDGVLILPSEY